MDRLTVAEAAERLGITQDAVYKRIQRATIEHDKDSEGRVHVYLDASDMPTDKSTDESTDKSERDELLAELRTQNEHLRQEVEAWREESRRKDAIIMTMAQRIPEIEPPRDARESDVSASEEPGKGDVPPEPEKRVSWWRRLFGR